MFDLEGNIRSWSDRLRSRGKLSESDIRELESHLRDGIDELSGTGLQPDEAFIISVKRLGNVNAISSEYAKLNMTSFWKHLLVDEGDRISGKQDRRNIVLAVVFALLAGTLMKIPELFGLHMTEMEGSMFYLRNLSLFILPFAALYFLIGRKLDWRYYAVILGISCLSAVLINVYPYEDPNSTELLTALHLPILLWLLVGVPYLGRSWRESKGRMDFLRFTGEAVIYGGLVFVGIVALGMFVFVIFSAIGVDLERFVGEYLVVYGGCAAVMAAVYLVEEKKSVVENFAPTLAKIFSPLLLLGMLAFLITMAATGRSLSLERDFLIAFDLLLALVLGLVIYVISARGVNDPPNIFDYVNFALIAVALIVDLVALFAVVYRLSAYGVTPNKIAALGENLVLLVNLGGLAVLYPGFLRKKAEFARLEKWQTGYLTVYAVWMAAVALVFPLVFSFQ